MVDVGGIAEAPQVQGRQGRGAAFFPGQNEREIL